MRVLAYVPTFEATETTIARIDKELPDGDFNIEYAIDKADLGTMSKTELYDAVIIVVDATAKDPFGALKNINAGKLHCPLICLMHNGDSRAIFNILAHRAVSVTDLRHTAQQGVIKALVENAYYSYGGRSIIKTYGPMEFDYIAQTLKVAGTQVDLTVTEFKLLRALTAIPGVLLNREQLQNQAYDEDTYVDDRTIDSHIKRLRKKLNDVIPDLGNVIQTVYGGGYKFVPETEKKDGNILTFGPLAIDYRGMTVKLDGETLDLTISEFMVMKTMAQHYPDPVATETLVAEASKFGREADAATIDRCVYAISRKLEGYDEALKKLIVDKGDGTFILNLQHLDARAAKAVVHDIKTLGPVKINRTLGEASFRTKPLNLTTREMEILEVLIDNYPSILSLETLAEKVYGNTDKTTALVPTFNKLRTKLADANDGKDVIINKRGLGYMMAIDDTRTATKTAEMMDILTVTPWTLNRTRQEISVSVDGEKPFRLELNRQQYLFLSTLIEKYPQAAKRQDLMDVVYGDNQEGKDSAFNSLFSQLKARVQSQLGEDVPSPLRKIRNLAFRLDIDIEHMTPETLAACTITEVGAWAVNHTTQMFLFDGTPIAVTDNEYFLMEAMAASYPQALTTDTLANLLFDDNAANLNVCLTGLRKKLRDTYKITEALTVNTRGIGYLLNANRDELAEELKAAFETATLGDYEINHSLAQLTVGDKTIALGGTEAFALKALSTAEKPLTASDIALQSEDTYTETAIYHALSVTLKSKLSEAGIGTNVIFEDNCRTGYVLKGRRDAILENSDISEIAKVKLNHTMQELTVEGRTIDLIGVEYAFVKMLFENPKVPLSPADMAILSREYGEDISDSSLKQVKGRIQKKLEDAGVRKPEIISVKQSVGYYLTSMEADLNKTRLTGKRKTAITDVVTIKAGDLELNTVTDAVTYKGRKLETVSGGSFDILALLTKGHRTLVTKQDIALHFFGSAETKDLANIDRGIAGLRHMLSRAEDKLGDKLIRAVGVDGYTLALSENDYTYVKALHKGRIIPPAKGGDAMRLRV